MKKNILSNDVLTDQDVKVLNTLMLSTQNALLGYVTPNIRSVFVALREKLIYVKFYYDGPISEEDEENASEVETYIIASFPDPYNICRIVERVDYPEPAFGQEGFFAVYARKEEQK